MKKFVSMITALVMTITMGCEVFAVSEPSPYSPESFGNDTAFSNDFEVTGTNFFGTMLADTMTAELNEQQENNGYNVFSVEMSGNTAAVELETLRDSTVVVGIYDESGNTLLQTANANVTADDEYTTVTFTQALPQYFYIKAYLIDSVSMRPLCTVYECPNYTREMQEFFAKTTDDFAPDRVLNLDSDKTNNFAVYGENVIVIPYQSGVNTVISADNGTYVIGNADGYFTGLNIGDIFAYEYGEGELIIASVGSVSADGSTVTIIEADVSMEDTFDYIKIDTEAGTEQATIDNSELDDDVTFLGDTEIRKDEIRSDPYSIQPLLSIEGGDSTVVGKSYEFNYEKSNDNANLKINGEVSAYLTAGIKYYVSFSYQYIEASVDLKALVTISVDGNGSYENKIGKFEFPLIGNAVKVTVTPKVLFNFSVNAEITGYITAAIGASASNTTGITNLSRTPKGTFTADFEGSLYVGVELIPSIEIFSEDIAYVKLTGEAGVEIKAEMAVSSDDPYEKTEDSIHKCIACLDGEIHGKYKLDFKTQVLNSDKLKYEKTFANNSIKIADFYFSFDHMEFGEGTCPHHAYKVRIRVADVNFSSILGANVYISGHDLVSGNAGYTDYIYLEPGTYKMTASCDGYKDGSKDFIVAKKAMESFIFLDKLPVDNGGDDTGDSGDIGGNGGDDNGSSEDNGDSGNTGGETEKPINSKKVQQISLEGSHSAAITTDGSLYLWGQNVYGQLGNGTTTNSLVPMKIMDNVTSVSLGGSHSAAITTDGSLYLWGDNDVGRLGNGTTERYSSSPLKIMDNVVSVSLGYGHSAAITTDGSLYLWGYNLYGQLGNSTTTNSLTPIKIMDNVASVSLGESHSAAITADGSLYMWGYNASGQLGGGTSSRSSTPIKIMDNVASVSLGKWHSAAITTDGNLYIWGYNSEGQLGNGTTTNSLTPIKIMENVVSVSLGSYHSAAITADGSLYTWGNNYNRQLGNGTRTDSSRPIKIMENVTYVSLGDYHSAAITADGSLYMWGYNGDGRLGNGTTLPNWDSNSDPIKIEIPYETETASYVALSNATEISAGTPFTNLLPNEVYNIYAMRSRTVSDPFSADNLLYISQGVTDSTGTLTYDYQPISESPNPVIFCKAMHEFDVENARITGADVTTDTITIKWDSYPGADMYKVYRVINGVYIEEGTTSATSYTFTGLSSGREYGFMVASRVNGEWSYRSENDVVYITTEAEQPEPDTLKGDADRDGKITTDDAVIILQYAAKYTVDIDLKAADVTGDGNVTSDDAVEILRKLAGYTVDF